MNSDDLSALVETFQQANIVIDNCATFPEGTLSAYFSLGLQRRLQGEASNVALTDLIYFLIRSPLILPAEQSPESIQAITDIRRRLAMQAGVVAAAPTLASTPPQPTWMKDGMRLISNLLADEFPEVQDVSIQPTLRPSFHARARPGSKELEVSLLTYPMLRNINAYIWNALDPSRGNLEVGTKVEISDPELLDMLCAWLPPYGNVLWSCVPTVRPRGPFTAAGCINSAFLQCLFIIAHEISHILLHEERNASTELEAEADEFAYWLLYRVAQDARTMKEIANMVNPAFSVGDIWMSVRWMYEILSIDRALGWRLSGELGDPPVAHSPRTLGLAAMSRSTGPPAHDLVIAQRGLSMLRQLRERVLSTPPDTMRAWASEGRLWLGPSGDVPSWRR